MGLVLYRASFTFRGEDEFFSGDMQETPKVLIHYFFIEADTASLLPFHPLQGDFVI
jgi:hypothetical protein